MPFQIEYTQAARDQLLALAATDRGRIVDSVRLQLRDEPLVETRNRKLLRPNPIARWELRVGDFRVFYEVDLKDGTVEVLAVGIKSHDVLNIGGEQVEL